MAKLDPRTEVIGIDEAQFMGSSLVEVAQKLADMGKRVIVLDHGRLLDDWRPGGG